MLFYKSGQLAVCFFDTVDMSMQLLGWLAHVNRFILTCSGMASLSSDVVI